MARSDMSDLEWEFIKPALPKISRGVKRVDDRRVINGIFYVLRTGIPWCDLLPGTQLRRNVTSICIGQAGCSARFRRFRSNAFAITMSLRMMAVMASLLLFPVETSCSYFAFMSELKRYAPLQRTRPP